MTHSIPTSGSSEMVIGNLKGKAQVPCIAAQGRAAFRRYSAHDCARFQAKADERTRLQLLEPGGGWQIERPFLGHQIHHLSARHAMRAARTGQLRRQPDANEGIRMRRRSDEHTSELHSLMRSSYAAF